MDWWKIHPTTMDGEKWESKNKVTDDDLRNNKPIPVPSVGLIFWTSMVPLWIVSIPFEDYCVQFMTKFQFDCLSAFPAFLIYCFFEFWKGKKTTARVRFMRVICYFLLAYGFTFFGQNCGGRGFAVTGQEPERALWGLVMFIVGIFLGWGPWSVFETFDY